MVADWMLLVGKVEEDCVRLFIGLHDIKMIRVKNNKRWKKLYFFFTMLLE